MTLAPALIFHDQFGEHGCCRVTTGPDGETGYQCGQLCGHDGECTWWTPGLFPFPPLLHPLDLLRAQIGLRCGNAACPNGHGTRYRRHCSFIHGWRWLPTDVSISVEPPPTYIHDQYGEAWEPGYAAEVEFQPCGCRYRLA
jgi:hypothetical protein